MNEFPISRAKVTPPPVREETLARERLLTWLEAAVRRHVVYVVAEAGYGKTTLLADFDRRSPVRCLWFKLDDTDRDWRTFLHYLVAAGREVQPGFGAATSRVLADASDDDSLRQRATDSFASELEGLADRPTAVIFDDYHAVDGAADVTRLVQRILRSLPAGISLVFLSRRRPSLRVARLQALDEVRELGPEDLRFSREETDRLFSESYNQPLETDVLDEVDSRAEGWAASLQLLRSGIRGRSPADVRAFVQRMAGAEGSLYDYLAEEVVGELPAHLRRFLMRTSVLDRVTPELARAALSTGPDTAPTLHDTRAFIQQSEILGLLSRRGESSRWSHRYHPLIRDYLLGKLAEEVEPDEIRDLHRAVARAAEATSWSVAAHHWLEAGDTSETVQVIERQIAAIASSGQYSLAARYLQDASPHAGGQIASIVRARLDLHAGRTGKAREQLRRALDDGPLLSPEALQVLMSIAVGLGDLDTAAQVARGMLASDDLPDWQRVIAQATIGMREVALDGSLSAQIGLLEEASAVHEREGRWQLAAISRYNLADTRYNAGQYGRAALDATTAIDFFRQSGGDANEVSSAFGLIALSFLWLDRLADAESALEEGERARHSRLYEWELSIQRAECLVAIGRLDEGLAEAQQAVDRLGPEPPWNALATISVTGAEIATKAYDFGTAERWLGLFDATFPTTLTAGLAVQGLTRARLLFLTGAAASEGAEATLKQLRKQGAWHHVARARLIAAAASGDAIRLGSAIDESARRSPSALRAEAAVICASLGIMDRVPESLVEYMSAGPQSWLPHLRHALDCPDSPTRSRNASLLERYGEWADVGRLRTTARSRGMPADARQLGKALARRTAPRVLIHDLGRTYLEVGSRTIEATTVRRKVAGLIIYLMTRPGFTATREQVLEALWPDSPPQVGTNSLHQTIYFLRRDLEPSYAEDISAGYVRLEGELVWLDPDLVDSASRRFSALAASRSAGTADAEAAIRLYRGRFAPEFEYEDWAIATREALHAAYLELVQRAVDTLATAGDWVRAAEIARMSLSVDPDADGIERSLIALYHDAGSHAAAAEQYSHFAAGHRANYGVEPPPLTEIVSTPNRR